MSMPYRNSDGKMIRIAWNTDSLVRLDEVSYEFNDFSSADKENKKLKKGMDELFDLEKKNFDLLMNNSLYPAYYLVSYDDKKVYSDPVDLIKFGDVNIDEDTLTFGIDLQLYNNIIFMIGNSNQMTTFNGSRNVWYKIMEAFSILSENNYRKLKYILENKYKYKETKIEKYCEDLNNYIYGFYEEKIRTLMDKENCYECFRYFNSLKESAIRKKIYSDLNEEFNDFLLRLLNEKTEEMRESGYCYDLFDAQFFAGEILELPDLNNRKREQTVQLLFNAYLDCINVRIGNNAFDAAKECYEIVDRNRKYFSYEQMRELESQKVIIDENYDKDPEVKARKKREKRSKIGEALIPICLVAIIVGIVSFVATLICGFKVPVWNYILVGTIIFIIILYFVDKKI